MPKIGTKVDQGKRPKVSKNGHDRIQRKKRRGAKYDTIEMSERMAAVARYTRQGYEPADISKMMNISRPTISRTMKLIREYYGQQTLADYGEFAMEQIESYRDVRREAWEAWERSKQDSYKTVQDIYNDQVPIDPDDPESPTREEAKVGSTKVTRECRLPANEYLRTIMDSLEGERIVRGFQKPPQNNGGGVVINLAQFYGRDTEAVNPIEQKIMEAETLPEAERPRVLVEPAEDADYTVIEGKNG